MGKANVDISLDPASEDKNITGNVNLSGFKIGFLKAFLPEFQDIQQWQREVSIAYRAIEHATVEHRWRTTYNRDQW